MLLQSITDRVFYLPNEEPTDRPVLGYVRGARHSLLIDAGNSPSHVKRLVQALQEQHLPLPDFCVLTHWHWDHTFGICAIKQLSSHPVIIAGFKTQDKLTEVQGWSWEASAMKERLESGSDIAFCDRHIRLEYPDPKQIRTETADLVFKSGLTLDLGGIHAVLAAKDSPHSRDAVLITIPEEGILFAGDACCKDNYENNDAYDPERLAAFLNYLNSETFSILVPGHSAPCPRAEIIRNLETVLAGLPAYGSFTIRPMVSPDIPALTAAFLAQGWTDREETLLHYLADQEAGTRHVFVAELNHRPVGYVTLLPLAKAGPFTGKYPEICDFNVLQDYQRHGIGAALFESAERQAALWSDTVTLGVGLHSGYGAAQRLYAKRGYLPDGTGVWAGERPAKPYGSVKNDDDLILYLRKDFLSGPAASTD